MEQSIIYTPQAIKFVKIVAETCLTIEQATQYEKNLFCEKMSKILPLLYFQATVLVDMGGVDTDTYNERFVTETDYTYNRQQIQQLLGEDDVFLDTFHPDMDYSDTPIAAFISENLSDIHQELKDMISNYQIGEIEIMHTALNTCIYEFSNHWGQKLLNVLKALHTIRYGTKNNQIEPKNTNQTPQKTIPKNDFFDFLTEE